MFASNFLVWFYGISTIVGYLMPNSFYTYKQSYFKHSSLTQVHSLSIKIVLFKTIQSCISTLFSSIESIDKALSIVPTPGKSGPGSDGYSAFPKAPVSSSDCFFQSLGESYSSAKVQLVYSTAPADWVSQLI